MGILEYLKEKESLNEFQDEKNEAYDNLRKQVVDISKIAHTEGFRAIVEYWTSRVDSCIKRLRTMKSDNFKSTQDLLNEGSEFLEWLKMIENPPL